MTTRLVITPPPPPLQRYFRINDILSDQGRPASETWQSETSSKGKYTRKCVWEAGSIILRNDDIKCDGFTYYPLILIPVHVFVAK